MVRVHAGDYLLIGTVGRFSTAAALIAAGLATTWAANWWVTGPGTAAPLNGYRFPLVNFDTQVGFYNGDHAFALLTGWANPEPWGVRTNKTYAELAFRLPDGPALSDQAELQLRVNDELLTPQLATRHISVWLDSAKLGEATVTAPDETIVFSLKGLILPRDPTPVMLRFKSFLSIGLVSFDIAR